MSATNRGTERQDYDFYRTHEDHTLKLIDQMDLIKLWKCSFLEPFAGDGAILDLFEPLTAAAEWAEIQKGRDYFAKPYSAGVIVSNPPYSLAKQAVEKTLKEAPFVAHLLRINFLGGQKRQEWWKGKEPTHLFTLSKRPAFVAVCKGGKHASDGKFIIKKPSCGKTYPLNTKGKCVCGGTIGNGTDATEYAWFIWDRLGLIKPGPVFRFI